VLTYHIVDSAEQSVASVPFASDLGVVFRLMPRAVLLAGEPAGGGLRTALVPTEQRLSVTFVVFS